MGELVEEAKGKGVLLHISPGPDGYTCLARSYDEYLNLLGFHTDHSCPAAASIAFLKALEFKALMGI